ncbi:MAG: SDR family NAD(P)-dependent oxidoreductase, partial [Deltaproteobacteria bacterium]|nr:SDR family NAD(P)-dependent oxidoreductase [Deltaproteobacteria bacterium]
MSMKLVLVTGAGRGIGREIALRLAADGYAVSGCARSTTELEETRNLSQGKIRVSPLDVTHAEDVDAWIKTEADHAARGNGSIWGLVTAAGIQGDIAPFTEVNWAEWKKTVEVNLYGTAHAC